MAGATHLESTRLALDHVRRFLEIRKGELSALDTEIEREAEPQVVGLTPQTPVNRKASTMKTYLLRDPNAVEPQNPRLATFSSA